MHPFSALEAAAAGARVLHLGQSAAAVLAIPSGFAELARGRVQIDVTTVPLASGAKAWVRRQAGPWSQARYLPLRAPTAMVAGARLATGRTPGPGHA
jgi:hypothetical protein